jgi:hypothetical protein
VVLLGAALAAAAPAAMSAQSAVRGDRVLLQGGGSLPTGHANVLEGNDDGSTGPHDLGFQLNFFGTTHSQVYVNNNGNLTFGGSTWVFTPFGLTGDLPVLTSNPSVNGIIAPFFADVDTRQFPDFGLEFRPRDFVDVNGNPIGRPAGVGLTSFAAYDATDPYGLGVGGHKVFSVTWSDVGYYGVHTDKTNTFQVNLIDRGDTGEGNFDLEFDYDAVEWETGDASDGVNGFGGFPAHAGFSNGSGDDNTHFELAGSGDAGAFLDGGPFSLTGHSIGSSTLGRYLFQIRNSGSGTPGETEQAPALPASIIPGDPSTGQGPTYVFDAFQSGFWADPPDSYGFIYDADPGTLFTGITLPGGFAPLDVCWGVGFGSCVNDVASGSSFDFLALAGGAQDVFRVTGIDPLVDSSNPTAFPTQVFFDTPRGSFTMQALTIAPTAAVPEPQTWALLGGGLLTLYGVRRRAARA